MSFDFTKQTSWRLWMAWRIMVSKKRNGLSFLTVISICGVAIGVGALVIVISVMGGFADDLKKNLLENSPHLEVFNKHKPLGISLKEYPHNWFIQQYPLATAIVPYIRSEVVLKNKAISASAAMVGVDENDQDNLPWPFKRGLVYGEFKLSPSSNKDVSDSLPGIIIVDKLMRTLNAKVGDVISVINPYTQFDNLLSGQPISFRFVITGVFVPLSGSGVDDQNRFAVINIAQARKFLPEYDTSLDDNEYVSGVAIDFKNPWYVSSFTKVLESHSNLDSQNWQQINRSLLFALSLEKYVMALILMLIVVVAAFSICGTLIITGHHRKSQLAILRSLGASKSDLFKLFVYHGAAIGFVGVFIGMVISISICLIIYLSTKGTTPNGLDLLQLPVKFLPKDYLMISSCAWLLTILSAVLPAVFASKQEPAEGLRCL